MERSSKVKELIGLGFRYNDLSWSWGGDIVFKAGILWLLGVPVVVIILLALFTNVL
jgi:hypothetical protein